MSKSVAGKDSQKLGQEGEARSRGPSDRPSSDAYRTRGSHGDVKSYCKSTFVNGQVPSRLQRSM